MAEIDPIMKMKNKNNKSDSIKIAGGRQWL